MCRYLLNCMQNTELHAVPGDQPAIITAQARKTDSEDTGYYFVNCRVTGGGAFLGRSWMPAAKVVFAYTEMGDAIHPEGWILVKPEHERSAIWFPFIYLLGIQSTS